jgi:hypothetical protein
MEITPDEAALIGKEVEASMGGETWLKGMLEECIDLFVPYQVFVHEFNESRWFALIRPAE